MRVFLTGPASGSQSCSGSYPASSRNCPMGRVRMTRWGKDRWRKTIICHQEELKRMEKFNKEIPENLDNAWKRCRKVRRLLDHRV